MNFLSRSLYVDKEAGESHEGERSLSASSGDTATNVPMTPKKWGKQPIRSFLCFDVEATCREGREWDYPNEIIVSTKFFSNLTGYIWIWLMDVQGVSGGIV